MIWVVLAAWVYASTMLACAEEYRRDYGRFTSIRQRIIFAFVVPPIVLVFLPCMIITVLLRYGTDKNG